MHVNACARVLGSVRERMQSRALTLTKKKHITSTTKKKTIVGAHKNCACIRNKIYHTNHDGELKTVAGAHKNKDARTGTRSRTYAHTIKI